MSKRILVIAPHPDDETLGCGGTLLKHRAAGDSISWVIVTKAHEPSWPASDIERREKQIEQVSDAYGFENRYRLTFPTTLIDTIPLGDVIEAIAKVASEAKPDWVYTIHSGDVHSDHRAIFEATISAIKSFGSHGVRRLLSYETISSTDATPSGTMKPFAPNVYSDITKFIDRKLEIMSMYEGEVQPYPLPRALESIKALARFRGATVAVEYAEAFMLLREIA